MTEIIIPDPTPDEPSDLMMSEQRKATEAFIAVFPVVLTMVPRVKVKTPSGGWVWEEQEPRSPQVFTVVDPTGDPAPTATLDGIERRVEMQLVGSWDASVERGDVFAHRGRSWEVVELFLDNGYETRAWVSGRG